MRWIIAIFILFIVSCQTTKKIEAPQRTSSLTGNDFYHHAFAMKWQERDSFAVKEILAGNMPSFLKKFEKIKKSYFTKSNCSSRAFIIYNFNYL
jgi:hypothetical protein